MPNPVRSVFFRTPVCTPPPNRDATLRLLVVWLISNCKQSLEILRVLREWRPRDAPPIQCRWVGALSCKAAYVRPFQSEMATVQAERWADYYLSMSTQALREEMNARDILIHVPTKEAFSYGVFYCLRRTVLKHLAVAYVPNQNLFL